MPTTKKKATVKEIEHLFSSSQVLIFTDYRGLTVADITNLRRQLREKGVEYHVTKNTLTILASGRAGFGDLGTLLDGPTAIAFVGDDIPGAAKVLNDFVRTSRILQIRGGLVGHSTLNVDQVSDLTKILPREQYIAKLLGSMQSPISGMMGALTGIMRGFVNVLQARVDQMKEQGDGATSDTAEATATSEATAAPDADTAAAPAPTAEASAAVDTASANDSAPAEADAPAETGDAATTDTAEETGAAEPTTESEA